MSGGIEEMNRKERQEPIRNFGYMKFDYSIISDNRQILRASAEIDEHSDIYEVIPMIAGVLITGGFAKETVINGFRNYVDEYGNEEQN